MDKVNPRLSPREKQVLAMIGSGASDRKIGSALNLSTGTIKVYVSKLRMKLYRAIGQQPAPSDSSRVALALLAIGLGLAPVPTPIPMVEDGPTETPETIDPETLGHESDPHDQKV